ncbi:lysyl-tRNA synthetase [Puccinia graminis f. sp. tritici]|uniref:Lysyl-tRNA synthetase n=1 Tax=Puccinia graminis f. sp. tritici TaxID=56615 RepID=A0A5B0P1P9_PUCGR|nr:lysyl-tRNA synthetase [Puccinia graminis f. sp. tritici]
MIEELKKNLKVKFPIGENCKDKEKIAKFLDDLCCQAQCRLSSPTNQLEVVGQIGGKIHQEPMCLSQLYLWPSSVHVSLGQT